MDTSLSKFKRVSGNWYKGKGFLNPEGPGNPRELLALAFPMVISQACETIMMVTDRAFLSRLGGEYMNAAMGGGITCFLFMTFFVGLLSYSNALVAQYLGSGQREKCPLVVTQGALVALGATAMLFFAIPLGEWYFRLSGVPREQLGPQVTYFTIVMGGVGIYLFRAVLSSFFSGIGKTSVVMFASLASMIVNVVANYVLIFGKWGFPVLGIAGAAYGTLLGAVVGVGIIGGAYFSREIRETYKVLSSLRFDFRITALLFRFGYPAGLELFLNLLAMNAVVMAFHSYGVAVGAAATVAFNWDLVSFIPLIGLNIAITSLVGRYMGAGKPDVAHRVTMTGMLMACCYSGVLLVIFMAFPQSLVRFFHFSEDPSGAFPMAVFMVRLISFYVFADAVAAVFSGALRGAGDTFWAMSISVGTHAVLAVLVVSLVRVYHVSPKVSWGVFVTMIFAIGVGFYARYRAGSWRSIRVVHVDPI